MVGTVRSFLEFLIPPRHLIILQISFIGAFWALGSLCVGLGFMNLFDADHTSAFVGGYLVGGIFGGFFGRQILPILVNDFRNA
jgi:hypothetical protein